MTIDRRQFLAGAMALSFLPEKGTASPSTDTLEAKPGKLRLISAEYGEYPETDIWGYGGSVPGPLIRATQGDELRRRLVNSLPQATSIHWHGLRVPNAMDGVPGITQDAVAPGADFLYQFALKDAGTYWYHSHNQSTEQVARGLYGVLIVDERTPLDIDHDITVVLDDWRLTQEAQISADFGSMHDWTHGGRLGNFVHAHLYPSDGQLQQNQRLRLRLVNVATDRIMTVSFQGVDGVIAARDGMPLVAPEFLGNVTLGPAERADLLVDVTADQGETVQIAFQEGGTGYLLEELPVTGRHANQPRSNLPLLPENPIERIASLDKARTIPLLMEGGAMGGLQQGKYKGRLLNPRELVQEGQIWTFNGEAGLPEKPFLTADQGELIRIPMTNNTAFPHAIHLHGTHFQEVLPDGSMGPLKDTLLMSAQEKREIAFTANNPGDWLLHCHMLSHQAAGMKTWLRIT